MFGYTLTLPVVGTVNVVIKYGTQTATLPLLVVKGAGPSLLGRNWLAVIKLDWHDVFCVDRYKAVFEPGLGKVTGPRS